MEYSNEDGVQFNRKESFKIIFSENSAVNHLNFDLRTSIDESFKVIKHLTGSP